MIQFARKSFLWKNSQSVLFFSSLQRQDSGNSASPHPKKDSKISICGMGEGKIGMVMNFHKKKNFLTF